MSDEEEAQENFLCILCFLCFHCFLLSLGTDHS